MPMFRLMLGAIRRKPEKAPQKADSEGFIEVEDSRAFMLDYFNQISGQQP